MALGSLHFYIPGVEEGPGATLNFEQNISVSESKAANYAKYDILARPSTIYAYLGAKARILKLSFDVLLDHLATFDGGSGYEFGEIGDEGDFEDPNASTRGGTVGALISEEGGTQLDHWVKVIRKSIANESEDPTQGPPTVIFNYTKMYKDIACICKDYKMDIKAEDKAGFTGKRDDDDRSPRLVSFSLTLEEII